MVLVTNLVTAVRNLKKDPTHITKFKDLLSDAGFVNVVERKYAVPVNPWAPGKHSKAMGEMNKMNLLAVVEPMSMAVLPGGLGVSIFEPLRPHTAFPIKCLRWSGDVLLSWMHYTAATLFQYASGMLLLTSCVAVVPK